MLAVCGGGSANDAFDTASTVNAASRNATAFTANGTVTVKGMTGTKWAKVPVVDMTTGEKVAGHATPSNGHNNEGGAYDISAGAFMRSSSTTPGSRSGGASFADHRECEVGDPTARSPWTAARGCMT
ncbi:hypothetical protein AWB78_00188 [Caballeronia calidae]|uniref:Uncharacterized protein n=1 Tax=Caballeronia calidae TaxID=1777139 RepID=A0A157Z7H3_9BURK|nr:hypothetical protein [Caballeronia calidae]SAK41269.1 hypothetical protein AWB78_00188 [Caballeronia calidae]